MGELDGDSFEELGEMLARMADREDEGPGSAAKEHLAAGNPIYIRHDDTPPGLQIKVYPDGRRELVRFNRAGDEVIGPI